MNIPGLSNQDDNDLARKARITASSESKLILVGRLIIWALPILWHRCSPLPIIV